MVFVLRRMISTESAWLHHHAALKELVNYTVLPVPTMVRRRYRISEE